MKLITRDIFNKMREMKLLNDDKFHKNYYITGKAKHNSKRKKIYICEQTFSRYLKIVGQK